MIRSYSFSQHEVLQNIQQLYCRHGFDLDPTYGFGHFYESGQRQTLLPGETDPKVYRPKLYFDRYRDTHGAWRADARHLPLKDRSIRSVIIDPPFLAGGGGDGIMTTRYGKVGKNERPGDVWELYRDIMNECLRILKPHGVLVVKCQDQVHGRTQYLTSFEIVDHAISIGFYPKDVFILLAKNRPTAHNQKVQQHSRKFHSYFFVFRKANRKVGYSREPKERRAG